MPWSLPASDLTSTPASSLLSHSRRVMSSHPLCHDMDADGMGVTLWRDSAEPRLNGSGLGEGGASDIGILAHWCSAGLTLLAGQLISVMHLMHQLDLCSCGIHWSSSLIALLRMC